MIGFALLPSKGAAVAEEGEKTPPLLAIFLSEEDVSQKDQGGDGGADPDQPTILRASTILLNETVLNEIDPHEKDVSKMPIVRVELFDDLVVDVEFVSAQPKFRAGEITYDESGNITDVEVLEDGFLIRGREPDEDTRPVVSGNGHFVSLDMAHSVLGPRQVFVHHNEKMLGDLNGDGNIDDDDLLILLQQWCNDAEDPACNCLAADLNNDGKVGVPDVLILNANRIGD